MKQALKSLLRRFGYDLQTLSYSREFTPCLHLAEILRRTQIKCVLDVGANVGQFRDFLRTAVGFKGWIVSFEPVPDHVAILKSRILRDRKWILHALAVSDVAGALEMNVAAHGVLSSFLDPVQASPADVAITKRISMEAVTLDSMIDTITATSPLRSTFLKIDTQGFDLKVLRGARQMLVQIPAVQVEVPVLPIYEGMPTFEAILRELRDRGFELTALFPVARDSSMRVIEFDGLFVNHPFRGWRESTSAAAVTIE
jgi:FkbM family methyltransferase